MATNNPTLIDLCGEMGFRLGDLYDRPDVSRRYERMKRNNSGHLTTSDIDNIKKFIMDRTKDAETSSEFEYLNKLWWKLDSVYDNALDKRHTHFTVENTNSLDTLYGILSTESVV